MRARMSRYFDILKQSPIQYQSRPVSWQDGAPAATVDLQPLPAESRRAVAEVRVLISSNRLQSAGQRLAAALSKNSNAVPLLFLQGELLRLRGMTNLAAEAYFQGLLRNPRSEQIRNSVRKLSGAAPRAAVTERARVQKEGRLRVVIAYDEQYKRKPLQFLWFVFGIGQALWRYEGFFSYYYPDAPYYFRSFAELLFCYRLLLDSWREVQDRYDRETFGYTDLAYLSELHSRGLLEGYLFFEMYGQSYFGAEQQLLRKYIGPIRAYYTTVLLGKTQDKR